MAANGRRLTPDERRQIGAAVRHARANRIPWKVLEAVYGRSREQLWRYAGTVTFPAASTATLHASL